jgi:hypothetical protein
MHSYKVGWFLKTSIFQVDKKKPKTFIFINYFSMRLLIVKGKNIQNTLSRVKLLLYVCLFAFLS